MMNLQQQMGMQQPVMNMQPQMGMQQPQMGMQQPMMNMQPQMGMQQPMMNMQQPMMNMQPQMGMQQMGMMPDPMMGMPQMGYAMPQMQYGMPQFVGYDAMGNPLYVQQVPQVMGYDAYGNPMYTMVTVPVQMPQMGQVPVMPSMPMMQPQMPVMEIAALPVQDVPAQEVVDPAMPEAQMPSVAQASPMPGVAAAAADEEGAEFDDGYREYPDYGYDDYEETEVKVGSEDMPMSAEYLMTDDENAEQATIQDEKALLDRIFSDDPKSYSMSSNAKPGAMSFSIRLGSDEFTSVRDEEAPPPSPVEEETPKSRKRLTEPKEKPEPKTPAKKKPATTKKTSTKIISPEDFFDDKPRQARGTIAVPDLDKLNDDQLVEQLQAMQAQTTKKSRRSMKAAVDGEVDATNMIPDVMPQ